MPLLSDLISQTRAYVSTGIREGRNQLSQDYIAGGESISLKYASNFISPGIYISIDLEVLMVWEVSGTTLVVQGGQMGSTPANHSADAVVLINPRFPDFAIMGALNAELLDLSSPNNGLFNVKTMDFVFNPVIRSYDLAGVADLLDVLTVRYKTPLPNQVFPSIRNWRLDRNQIDADFPSGYALTIYDGGFPGQVVYVQYKTQFGQLANLTDDVVATTGLPATAVDIPPIGAVIRLVAGMEVERNALGSEGDAKRAEEVPPGAILNSTKAMMMLREQRIQSEASRLEQQYSRQGPWL